MKAKLIYGSLILAAILIGVYIYLLIPNRFNESFLIIFALLPFLMFATGIHGLIAHMLTPDQKERRGPLLYPLIMGALFIVLFLIHIFVVLPIACPNFMHGLK